MRQTMITVVGSLNMDLVIPVTKLPRDGQTMMGGELSTAAGGKGANQAVAAARTGAAVALIGAVGDDAFGSQLRRSLETAGVDIDAVRSVRRTPTGVASVAVDRRGENQIIVSPGANYRLSVNDVNRASTRIRRAHTLLVQWEVPAATVERAMQVARRSGVRTILNAAPAARIPRAVLALTDLLVVNEQEAAVLLRDENGSPAERVQRLSRQTGGGAAILTLGRRGSWICAETGRRPLRCRAHRVRTVDSTGAGDTYVGALAAVWGPDGDLARAARFASAAAALTASRAGAQPAIPTRRQVEELLAKRGGGRH